MSEKAYHCQDCRKTIPKGETGAAPDCCGKPMELLPLEICLKAPSAEHDRLDDSDEPCDDGRAGS